MMSSAFKLANDHSEPDGPPSSNTKPSVPNTFLSSALSSISGPWSKSAVSSTKTTFTTSSPTSSSSTASSKNAGSASSGSLNRRGRTNDGFSAADSYDLWKSTDSKSAHLSKSPSGSVESAWSTGGNHFSLGASKASLGVPVSPVLSTNSRSSDHGTSGVSPAFGASSSPDPSALFLGPPGGAGSLPRRTQPIPLPSASPASASAVGNGQSAGNLASSVTTIASSTGSVGDDELIPTAIVIKNIPFAIKKEQLLDVMTSLSLPLPFAFNYHFDNGVFRGLAFANFTSPEETAAVISHLNGREIGGRKLRVEYKKMLPLAERERIEREKRERRGQLEEQHRGQSKHHGHHNHGSNHSNASSSHGSANSVHGPMSAPGSANNGMRSTGGAAPLTGLDLNDPETLEFYSQLLLFRDDKNRKEFAFNSTLGAQQRRIIVMLCGQLGLFCSNINENVITKHPPSFTSGVNNSSSTLPIHGGVPGHMGPAGYFEGTGAMQQPQPQYGNFLPQHTLRGTKSFADIRTPSYPYNVSGSGTPNGSPYFTSQTPPPTFQHGANAPFQFHGDIQHHNTFVPGAGASNMSYPLSYQHQQRAGGASFSPHPQLMTHSSSSQPQSSNFDYMPSLNDSFSNMMSLGGSASSISTYQPFNTPRVQSANPVISDAGKSNTTSKNDTQSSATSDCESSSSRSPPSTLGAIGSKHTDDTKNE